MYFIGREKELAFLENEYAQFSSFVALTGREGLGQTAIINAFEQGKNAMRFSALIEIDSQCRRRFQDSLTKYTGAQYLENRELDSWESLFLAIAEYKPNEKKLIIMDNVQFLIEANNRFLFLLRNCWDGFLSKCNIMLITAGPIRTTTVQHYFRKDGIFRDGVVRVLHMQVFTFAELHTHHPDLNFTQLVELYTFTGGVPLYLDMFGEGTNIMGCLEDFVMNDSGYNRELPLQLLEKELREPATYFSILTAISRGNTKLQDIAKTLDMKTNSLGPYLSLLMKLDLIERQVPVTEATPEKSHKGMYVISDHFVDFWFKFISPYHTKLDQGNTAYVREKLEEGYLNRLVRPSYIKICRQILVTLCDAGEINFSPERIGSFWSADCIPSIDIIAINKEQNQIFVANCYYLSAGESVTPAEYITLSQHLADIEELKAFENVTFGLFTNTGFNSTLQDLARSSDNIILIEQTKTI